jgi:hydroxymethylpyrimidine/phosphomethylpyrimidine kinase
MLCNERIVSIVADRIGRRDLPNVVLDPVLAAKDGRGLLTPRGLKRLMADLLPKTLVVTPNLPEAAAMAGFSVNSLDDVRRAAVAIHKLGPRFVIVKGGHAMDDRQSIDLLYDGDTFTELAGERLPGNSVRGTGCIFSAALAAYIGKGSNVEDAARAAKAFVTHAIANAVQVGKGHPVWIG